MVNTRVRPNWDKWYGLTRWQNRRAAQLRAHPICQLCEARGIITPAIVVDHCDPHHGNHRKFEFGDLQSLCVDCHNGPKRSIERRGWNNTIDASGWPVDPAHPAYAKRW